jgi:FtsP/CotA-like multicopper oxidase with cupredoxin domain
VTLINHLDSTGLSIHWHGFEMINSLEYDGVVGITQCALAPQETMVYKFQVDETPGTYWYHTHSGALGVNAKNEIKAPLIVHPRSAKHEALVNLLNSDIIEAQGSLDALNFYDNERLLFFSDGFLVSESHKQLKKVGGLNPPVSKNDDGFTVGSFPYHYGTCNGKLREVIPVEAGQKFKFRLLNGGTLYGFRISIDGLPMTIVAADSEPVVPYEVDEVILHSAERFDVEIDIPLDMANTTVWIRADTLESIEQGYQVRDLDLKHQMRQ